MAIWHRIPAASTIALAAGFLVISAMASPASFAAGPIDPSLTKALLDRCAVIAEEEVRGDDTHRGQCVAKTGEWIAALRPAVAASEDDASIADLVVKLAVLVKIDRRCKLYTTEIPEAINLASAASFDPQQKVRIEEISFTIANCVQQLQTAAINASPSF